MKDATTLAAEKAWKEAIEAGRGIEDTITALTQRSDMERGLAEQVLYTYFEIGFRHGELYNLHKVIDA